MKSPGCRNYSFIYLSVHSKTYDFHLEENQTWKGLQPMAPKQLSGVQAPTVWARDHLHPICSLRSISCYVRVSTSLESHYEVMDATISIPI